MYLKSKHTKTQFIESNADHINTGLIDDIWLYLVELRKESATKLSSHVAIIDKRHTFDQVYT